MNEIQILQKLFLTLKPDYCKPKHSLHIREVELKLLIDKCYSDILWRHVLTVQWPSETIKESKTLTKAAVYQEHGQEAEPRRFQNSCG